MEILHTILFAIGMYFAAKSLKAAQTRTQKTISWLLFPLAVLVYLGSTIKVY